MQFDLIVFDCLVAKFSQTNLNLIEQIIADESECMRIRSKYLRRMTCANNESIRSHKCIPVLIIYQMKIYIQPKL